MMDHGIARYSDGFCAQGCAQVFEREDKAPALESGKAFVPVATGRLDAPDDRPVCLLSLLYLRHKRRKHGNMRPSLESR
jgi:hypothetical protein